MNYPKAVRIHVEEMRIIDPEIQEMADQIASDPHAFQKSDRDGQQNGRDRRKEKHRDIHGCDRQFASSNGDIWFGGACCKKFWSSRVREIASVVYHIETVSKERLLPDHKRERTRVCIILMTVSSIRRSF